MTEQEKDKSFEQKLEELETLVEKMEEGGMQLKEIMSAYEQGTALVTSLKGELDRAQAQMLKLRGDKLEDMEPDNAV